MISYPSILLSSSNFLPPQSLQFRIIFWTCLSRVFYPSLWSDLSLMRHRSTSLIWPHPSCKVWYSWCVKEPTEVVVLAFWASCQTVKGKGFGKSWLAPSIKPDLGLLDLPRVCCVTQEAVESFRQDAFWVRKAAGISSLRSFSVASGFLFLSCGLFAVNRAKSMLPGVEWCDKALSLALVVGIYLLTGVKTGTIPILYNFMRIQ